MNWQKALLFASLFCYLMRGIILDVDRDPAEKERTIIRVFLRTKDGTEILRTEYTPYFYVIDKNPQEIAEKISKMEGVKQAVVVKRFIGWEEKEVVQVFVRHPKYIQRLKEKIEAEGAECREHDINPERKWLMEQDIAPMDYVDIEQENGWIKNVKKLDTLPDFDLRIAALDLEVYARDRMPDPARDPIIMISYVDTGGYKVVLTTKEIHADFVRTFESETQMIAELNRIIKERDPDIIMGYNSDAFDLPYLKERAKVLGLRIPWGRDGSEPAIRRPRGGSTVDIRGRMHVDVYQIIEFMAGIGAINTFKLDLENVYKAVLGKEKVKIDHMQIASEWRNGNLERLALYNLQDSEACLELGLEFLPLYIEIAQLTFSNLYSATRFSPSQIVENRLIYEAFKRNKLVPKKPKEEVVRMRMRTTYQGAFVREPVPGLHENIVVFDFRSLYPTIIISHNVDPDTANAPYCTKNEAFVSPVGHYFCKKPKGLIPAMLEVVLEERFRYKRELKKYKKGSREYKILYAKQQALKIIANSTYGYMGFARARWYCKECAEAITAWAREYIKQTMEEAERFGFKVIYGDTDSVFCVMPKGWGDEKIEEFLQRINSKLPPPMALEFEGKYVRGIFITKRRGERAAKKKYALIDEEGRLKITGLEYVRRDWAEIAREVQGKVLEYVLKAGDVQKALEYVRKVIDELRSGKVPKEKLIIYTEIQKPLDAYEQKGPHVVAALKAVRKGKRIEPGMIIGYIITKKGGSISDKAELAEFVEEGNYDAEYYINNQVIPAILPIFETLGYSEKDLRKGEAQKTLFDFV